MIYLDNAATTQPLRIDENIYKTWGNPSSNHCIGESAASIIDYWKKELLSRLFKSQELHSEYEIVFTSGGSESDCLAILGMRYNNKKHIITSCIEHKAVLNACKELENHFGFKVTYLPVNRNGFVNAADVARAINEETCLVSIMAANNEIGSIQPIDEIAQICKEKNVLFHTDAVQMNFHNHYDGIDMFSLSGHKFHSIKGIGCLVKKKDVTLEPIIYGGSQQNGLRAGTENVYGIINMCCNLCYLYDNKDKIEETINYYSDMLKQYLLTDKRIALNVDLSQGEYLPSILSFRINDVPADALEILLSSKKICVSNGSACNSKSIEASYVLTKIGLSKKEALSTIRISLPLDIKNTGLNESVILKSSKIIIECIDALNKIFDNNRG